MTGLLFTISLEIAVLYKLTSYISKTHFYRFNHQYIRDNCFNCYNLFTRSRTIFIKKVCPM